MLPFIILGGIHTGAFTPTEASAVAVFYARVGRFIYRTLTLDRIPAILVRTAVMTASVMLIISTSEAFAWALTVLQIPQTVSEFIVSPALGPVGFPSGGQRLPAAVRHLHGAAAGDHDPADPGAGRGRRRHQLPAVAMIVILNLTLGMITPPVGGLLFVTSVVTKVPMNALVRELWPLLGAEIVVLALLTAGARLQHLAAERLRLPQMTKPTDKEECDVQDNPCGGCIGRSDRRSSPAWAQAAKTIKYTISSPAARTSKHAAALAFKKHVEERRTAA